MGGSLLRQREDTRGSLEGGLQPPRVLPRWDRGSEPTAQLQHALSACNGSQEGPVLAKQRSKRTRRNEKW